MYSTNLNNSSNWNKFSLLMWKNWRIQWNHKKQLIIEIILPILFAALLIVVRSLVDPQTYNEPIKFPVQNITFSSSVNITENAIKRYEVAYYPKSNCLEDVAKYVQNWLTENNDVNKTDPKSENANVTFYVTGYDDVNELNRQVRVNGIIAGVQFDESFKNDECPHKISYSIRFPSELRQNVDIFGNQLSNWLTNNLFPILDFGGPRLSRKNPVDGNPSYYMEGFLGIQHAFALGFMEKFKKSATDVLPDIKIQRFPYPPYVLDLILTGLESMVSFIILISFVYPVSQIVKYVTTEKEKQLKEVMKIMGLPNWLHWTAWFLKTYPMALICVTLMVILFKVHWSNPSVSVLTYCDWSVLLVFLYIYCISMVTFCFMLATFFSKANTASAVSALVWFIWFLPYQFTDKSYSSMGLSEKMGLSLFSNTAMGYGFKIILKLEGTGEGLQWNNLFRPVNSDDNFSVGLALIMLLVDSALYMLIALYIEKILPGSYGVPEKWYFPFTKKFWCSSSIDYASEIPKTNGDIKRSDPAAFEPEPKNKKIGLSIKNLHKDFGDKIAVNQLTLDLYEDEITVLLGHNGAGKTTTISMLTGMIPPSQGTAVLNGYDIRTNLMSARMSLGLCPQHNILFDELTVREHIIFYSRLKGLKNTEVKAEVEKYVGLLELENKIDTQSKKLSGGMKRKLSIAAALCGGSKVVLCDEPTSGMDPSARRALWDLLEIERKGRTILLSTHFMDEADVLGDRIAIMCSGELKAYGTTFFLKKRYGAGYHLICVKKEECQPADVTRILQKYIPDIVIESDIGSELTYQLPDKYSNHFEKLLTELDERSDEINLNGYGISNTTLEEVFMLVGSDRQDKNTNNVNGITENGTLNKAQNKYVHLESLGDSNRYSNSFQLTGIKLCLSQWKAMLLKKYLYNLRNYIILIIQNFMPIFFVVVTVLIFKTFDPFKELKPIKLDLSPYSKTVTVLESKESTGNEIVNEYEKYIKEFGKNHKYVQTKNNFEEYILELGKKNLIKVNSDYIIGGTIALKYITAAFNAQLLHVLPVTLNAIHNAVLRSLAKDSSYTIEVTNHPLPYAEKTKLQTDNMINFGYQLSINLSFAMSFVISFYLLFQIKERVSRAKLLQFVSGVRVLTFWLSQFLVDYATLLITSLITIITLACFQQEGLATGEELGRAFLIFMLFGISSLPLTYLWGYCFTDSATGFIRVSIFNVFTGMALSILVFILNMFVEENIVNAINGVALIFPNYVLAKSLDNVNKISRTTTNCLKLCDLIPPEYPPEIRKNCNMKNLCMVFKDKCCVPDYFAWEEPGIGSHILYTTIVTVILFAILFLKEYRLIDGFFYCVKSLVFEKFYKPTDSGNPLSGNIDEDVKEEKLNVSRMSSYEIKNTNLVLDQISKYYWKFLAVNNISVAVRESECFGLLGVNGAGKTTTFKMMTGDERITYGEAYIKGLSVKSNMNSVYKEIGYCPQFDALLEDLTGRETLHIFALLRGIPKEYITHISEDLAKGFGFMKHFDKQVKTYSGGNKRKLSASLALIGNPSVVYLDEPTTGMDPGAKRQLWNKVCQIRDSGKSIILTSHSMEECEALCTRLAIMVNGEFKCIGSTQHLKNRFSKGLILKIKIHRDENSEHNPRLSARLMRSLSHLSHGNRSIISDTANEEVEKIIRFVKEHFAESELKEQHQGLLTFYIPLLDIRWSKIFGIMEANKAILNIEDYSISQTTLEEIFLEFAQYQRFDNRVGQ